MSFVESLLRQRKLVLTAVLLLAASGLASWLTMTRQEDPRVPEYWALVVVQFPGADAETVERLVLDPIEEQLAQVDELAEIESTANPEVAVIRMKTRDDVADKDEAWDRVREALDEARRELPEGVGEPRMDDQQQDQEAVVYALTGHPDPLVLADAAEVLKEALLEVPGVAEVHLVADPGEQVTIELDDSSARRLGLTPAGLAAQLGERTHILPGGALEIAGRAVRLRPRSDFRSVEEIRATPVLLPSGETVPLGSVATVRHGPEEPARARMRFNREPAVGLGVVPRKNINTVAFGEALRQRVADTLPALAPVEAHETMFQPDRVRTRLAGLTRALATGALVVAGVLVLAMGLRMGLLVSSVVPLVTLASLAVFALGGGVLHQVSIAAVVIALGMLVDNAIVVAENIQWRLDRGEPAAGAAAGAVRELAVPLAGATGTTLAAFLPMLLAIGVTADFTRTIPVMIILSLGMSYLFALFVTPSLGQRFLLARQLEGTPWVERVASRVGDFAVRRSGWVLVGALVLVVGSLAASGGVRQEFFPFSDRNQLVLDLKLPEGSHLSATDEAAARIEEILLGRPEIVSVASFVGRSAPHFYYNLDRVPQSPHYAQLVLETTSTEVLDATLVWSRELAHRELPQAEVVVHKLEQGPPVPAPVEVRLYGDSLADLGTAAEMLVAQLRSIPGTADVRHDLSLGSPVLDFEIDDAAAARRGLSRADVARSLFGATRGLPVGQLRSGEDPVPVVVRSSRGERFAAAELATLDVSTPGGTPIPLAQVARTEVKWRPGAIQHRDRRRLARVFSELLPGYTYSDVVGALESRLAEQPLPASVLIQLGGATEGSSEANGAMARTLPFGVLLLVGILMAEFRSFRRLAIVLVTVPLAATGVVPGLLLGEQPFGFMSLLGVMALAGVVVNNAIVLLEVIEARRREGAAVPQAVHDAVERRVRPILLTTVTTVVGLLPLAFSESTLWPPLAWAMISGLIASTLLTLLVVPALYRMLFTRPRWLDRWRGRSPGAGEPLEVAHRAAVLGLALTLLGPAAAAPAAAQEVPGASAGVSPPRLTLEEAMARASERPRAVAAERRAAAARWTAAAERRAGRWPSLSATVSATARNRLQTLDTPIGDLRLGERRGQAAEVLLAQPLLVPDLQLFGAPAARSETAAAALESRRILQESAAAAAEAFLDILGLDARLEATRAFIDSLEASLDETEARRAEGRALRVDALKVRLALDQAGQDHRALEALRRVATQSLGRAVGLPGSAEPAWDGPPEMPPPPEISQAVDTALAARPDLAALQQRIAALELRRKAVQAEGWPRLEATARYQWIDGGPFADDRFFEGGLQVRWNPLAARTRAARTSAVTEELAALRAELAEARRTVEISLESALAELATARGELEVGKTGVIQATETLRVERERHRAGRVTTNDLLIAEATLRDRRTLRELAALDVVRAWVRLDLALGQEPGRW